ncbi:MAG: histidine kinase dimerization/phosphoacceptor domain -containing protein [Clostridiales bacterium]|nr:histidine kinase dimerization/phosphoacceptor domain -containing protein [Clostridiales bacterium]
MRRNVLKPIQKPEGFTFETLIARISTRFINLPTDKIDAGINLGLSEIGKFVGADRCYIYLKNKDNDLGSTYAWCKRGTHSWIHNWRRLPVESFPWWADKLSRFEAVAISRGAELPAGARAKKEFVRSHNIKSFLAVPVEKAKVVTGFLGLDTVREEKTWPSSLPYLLKLAGEIFLNALEHKRSAEIIHKRTAQLELIHRIQGEIQVDADVESVLTAAAESIGKAFGHYKISLNLYDKNTDEIVYLLGWNKTGLPLPRGHRQKLGEGLIGKAALLRQTIVANDVAKEPGYLRFHLSRTKAELVVPLIIHDRLVGVLDLQDTKTDAFSEDEVAVLQSLSRYIAYVIDSRQKEAALQESTEKYRAIIENIQEGYYEVDLAGNFTFCNDSLCRMLGYPMEKVLGMNNRQYMDEESARRIYSIFNQVFKTGEPVNLVELEVVTGDGLKHHAEFSVSLVRDAQGQPTGFRGVVRDITERKLAEQRIRASLQEKEVLLKEIHHRVKNNLQVISSLLNLQAYNSSDPQLLKALREGQNRIRSMALVHEKLYQSKDLSRIDFGEYIRKLSVHLFQSYQVDPGRIELKQDIEGIFLDINTAIPCGLIMNELISNSLKHAFPEGRKGEIYLELRRQDEKRLLLSVRDNGVGLPEDLDIYKTKTLGMQIVTLLAFQLDGTIELSREQGTEFRILFQELRYPPRI